MINLDQTKKDVDAARKLAEDINELMVLSEAPPHIILVALVSEVARRAISQQHLNGLHLALDLSYLNKTLNAGKKNA
jgi:hypothetical protein